MPWPRSTEGRGTGMRLRASMPAEQMREARVPDEVGAARQRQRRGVARRNDDEASEAELGEGGRARVNLRPDGPIAIHGETRLVRRVETDHVEIAARRALSALRRMNAIPDRGMRFLQRLDFHRHAAEGKSPALEVEHLVGQSLEHKVDRLRVNLLRVLWIDAVVFELDGRGAAPEAELEAPAAQLVEHADFLDQPQRVVERHRPDQRTEPKSCRALRHGGKEHARRGRHAERRRVVLGEMISVEPRAIVGLCDFQAILVIVRERAAMTIEVIEDTEFHFLSAPSLASHWLWRQPILIICAGEATMMIGAYCAVEPSRSFSRPTASTSCVRATSLRMKSLTCAGA